MRQNNDKRTGSRMYGHHDESSQDVTHEKHSLDQEGNFIASPNALQNVTKWENPKGQTSPTSVFRRRIGWQPEKNAEDDTVNDFVMRWSFHRVKSVVDSKLDWTWINLVRQDEFRAANPKLSFQERFQSKKLSDVCVEGHAGTHDGGEKGYGPKTSRRILSLLESSISLTHFELV